MHLSCKWRDYTLSPLGFWQLYFVFIFEENIFAVFCFWYFKVVTQLSSCLHGFSASTLCSSVCFSFFWLPSSLSLVYLSLNTMCALSLWVVVGDSIYLAWCSLSFWIHGLMSDINFGKFSIISSNILVVLLLCSLFWDSNHLYIKMFNTIPKL